MEGTHGEPRYCESCGGEMVAEKRNVFAGYNPTTGEEEYSIRSQRQCSSWRCRNLFAVSASVTSLGILIGGGTFGLLAGTSFFQSLGGVGFLLVMFLLLLGGGLTFLGFWLTGMLSWPN